MDTHWLSRTVFNLPIYTLRLRADSHTQFPIVLGISHRCSRNFLDKFWFPQGHLMDAHGLSRTIFDFLTDTTRTLTDFHRQFFIFPPTPYGRSRTLMNGFRFSHEYLTDASGTFTNFHGKFVIFLRAPHGWSRTFTDNFWFLYVHLTDADGFSRTIFDFRTDNSRTLMDFYGLFLIFSRPRRGRFQNFTNSFRSIWSRTTHGRS